MRLNRVLLLAAIISVMMFALVFTISCSGEDGKNGKNGASCTVEQDGIDWNVICDMEVVGVLHGGDGPDGAAGKDGHDGENCWLNKAGTGFEVFCGSGTGSLKGSLNGCSIYTDDTNPYLIELSCGKFETSICNNQIFDASKYLCSDIGTVEDNAADFEFCPSLLVSVKGVKYDPKKLYCGYGATDKDIYDAPATLYEYCGDRTNDQPNYSEYNAEIYCRYFDKERKNAKSAGTETGDYCNGKPINKDGWRTEYCGYASLDTKVKSVITGACDYTEDGTTYGSGTRGPNELSFGQGYCEVKFTAKEDFTQKDLEKPKTTYSENLCGTSENNKPNNGAWKDEYCGYASDASNETDIRTKVYTGICSDATPEAFKAPHYEGYNKGYCEVKFADRDSFIVVNDKVRFKTTYTEDSFCNEDPTQRPNDGEWKGEYCGYASANGNPVVLQGICDDGDGPSSDGFNPAEYCQFDKEQEKTMKVDEGCDNGDKINENEWKGEYCGYASRGANATSRQTGICDDGKGPNSDEFGGGYCTVSPNNKKNGKTEYTDEFCGANGKVNENKWNSQYCGYANANADDADRIYGDACDDGSGKHKNSYNQPGYCFVSEPDGESTFGENWCNPEKKSGKYNEKVWKGEYCYKDKVVAACKGNLVGDTEVNHDSKNRCVLPSTKQRCLDGYQGEAITSIGGLTGVSSVFKDGLCRLGFDENTHNNFVKYDSDGSGGKDNCYNRGKNLSSSWGYGGSLPTNANGAFVYTKCEIQYYIPTYVPVDAKDKWITKNYCEADKSSTVINTTTNSNCYGGTVSTNGAGRGKNNNTINTLSNLGYEWGITGSTKDQKVIDTFVKKCEWDEASNTCKVTIEQASPVFPNSITNNSGTKGDCSLITGGTSTSRYAINERVADQECRYVP